ncbi:MAG TPA: cytochrome c biogenesis protein ResB [Bacillales bacterium]|nr:cytochrome c biogenesis protein ResB [Bacillales bacterium]
MMEEKQIVCECGHKNPYGTILCESCGKPLEAERTESREFLTMRYEGSARRSQTYNRTIIDKIWNYFSSVKIGVTLIVLTFIASAIGTAFPQEAFIPPNADPAQYYHQKYGVFGELYYELGFHNLYGSWWFMILIALLGLSIIVASIDRGIPLWRALKNQSVTRHDIFLKRQRLFTTTEIDDPDSTMSRARTALKKKHYKIREENGNLFAEKARFSRWGAYVNHAGLIIIMIGAMLRFIPGMYIDTNFWVSEGQTKPIPGTNGEYYIKNHKFILQMYKEKNKRFGEAVRKEAGGVLPKNFQTNVSLYRRVDNGILGSEPKLKKVKDDKIRVNHPLQFGGFSVYQVDFQMNAFSKMSFTLNKKSTGKSFGKFTVDLYNPKDVYKLGNGYKVKLLAYFPDFYFNDQNEPATKSPIPNNPAFIFRMFTPDKPKGETSFVAIRKNLDIKGNNEYKLSFAGLQTKNLSALNVHRDRTLWVIIIGAILFLGGVVQGLYWQYRRVWLKRKDGEIWLAAATNKNWFGLKKDLEAVTNVTKLIEPTDRLDEKKEERKEELSDDGSVKH